jgi:hypothetical protein
LGYLDDALRLNIEEDIVLIAAAYALLESLTERCSIETPSLLTTLYETLPLCEGLLRKICFFACSAETFDEALKRLRAAL